MATGKTMQYDPSTDSVKPMPTLREQLQYGKEQCDENSAKYARALEALDKYPGVEDLVKFLRNGYF